MNNCNCCGSKANSTWTEWAGHRIECESECSFTSGHRELKDAIAEWNKNNIPGVNEGSCI
jgi:hypothetical protein